MEQGGLDVFTHAQPGTTALSERDYWPADRVRPQRPPECVVVVIRFFFFFFFRCSPFP